MYEPMNIRAVRLSPKVPMVLRALTPYVPFIHILEKTSEPTLDLETSPCTLMSKPDAGFKMMPRYLAYPKTVSL